MISYLQQLSITYYRIDSNMTRSTIIFMAIQQATKMFADTQEVKSLFGHQVKPSRLWGPLSRTCNKLLGILTQKDWTRVERYNMYYV